MNSARFTAVLAALAVLLGVLAGLDVIAPNSSAGPGLVAGEPARSGAWTCTVVDAADDPAPRLTAMGAPASSNAAAEVVIDRIADGSAERLAPLAPFPETAVSGALAEAPGDAVTLLARWRRSPAVVSRAWQVESAAGPSGTLAGPCVSSSSARWTVPGLSTSGGAEAELILTNVFDVDASVGVALATSLGERAPALLENIVVPRRSVLRVRLNEHAPEERDLGVVVTTRSGRLAVEALQRFDAAIGGVDGISLVPAVAEPAEVWTIPWVAVGPPPADEDADDVPASDDDPDDGDDADDEGEPSFGVDTEVTLDQVDHPVDLPGVPAGWLWVTNPSEEPATILVTVHTPEGALLTDVLELTTVEPMSVARISLDATLPAGVEQVAVTVASEDGVPIAVSAATTVTSSDVDDTALVVTGGVPAPAATWVVPAEAGADARARYLAISNPAGATASVDVSLWTSQGILRLDALTGVEVGSGAIRILDLSSLTEAGFTDLLAVVSSRNGRVVVGHVGHALGGALDLVSHPGVPEWVWAGEGLISSTRLDPTLTNRLRPVE